MVTFDHRDAGTSESDWATSQRWLSTRALDLMGVRGAVVVAAHPDDETLGAGGFVSMMHARGTAITLVLASRGEASHAHSIAETRREECAEAMAEIAPRSAVIELNIPDGELREHRDLLRDGVRKAIRDAELIIAPWRGDGHRDHRIAGEVAVEIADEAGIAVLEYPLWMWHWAEPEHSEVPWDHLVTLELDAPSRAAKHAALSKYRSQREALDGVAPIIHEGMAAHFSRKFETFVTRA
jgi:LmbE family N-acetylglucosaminyl deacetylase